MKCKKDAYSCSHGKCSKLRVTYYAPIYTGCGLVPAPALVVVLAPRILKQFSNLKNPLHDESKLVLLYFIQKIKKYQ